MKAMTTRPAIETVCGISRAASGQSRDDQMAAAKNIAEATQIAGVTMRSTGETGIARAGFDCAAAPSAAALRCRERVRMNWTARHARNSAGMSRIRAEARRVGKECRRQDIVLGAPAN